ncbi:hypothetical protein FVEG_14901 [Fusarium verticillioides 7600]|uniref:NmrA-like domain-containing protein n=1 Tax=Gibberella moniliformis (strain M3125 / FGSC 7600) TaxID=334819 RepID=W7LSP8_GIBM7|nr:hypothetical protein FVEG_14901 [Fusarium verticillioides 7600]EWG38495.1 hypothetical protein FVEG_14901 [Fusarium verticillioides 7600]
MAFYIEKSSLESRFFGSPLETKEYAPHLLKNGFKVSVLTRTPSSAELPSDVYVIGADYTSAETLKPSLTGRGFDAIVIILNRLAYDESVVTMQAAVNTGIYRAIPSFFGVSLDNPEIAHMPFMKTKLPVLNDVLAKAEKGEITYTGINTRYVPRLGA